MRFGKSRIYPLSTLLALLSCSYANAAQQPANQLKPQLTKENGMSCGRTSGAGTGISCVAKQCYEPMIREFPDWESFERGFLRAELTRSGILGLPADFSDLCRSFGQFSSEEKEFFWLDVIQLVAAYESNFLTLTAYDDWINGKISTGRGLFQLSVSDCQGQSDVLNNYCALHLPRTNTRCAFGIIVLLMNSRPGKTMDALSAHWGSFRSSSRNSEGGRREILQKTFAKHPACNGKEAKARYDRLKPEMFPDSDFARAKLRPSYAPRGGNPCSTDQKVEANREQCRRFENYAHYDETDRQRKEQKAQ